MWLLLEAILAMASPESKVNIKVSGAVHMQIYSMSTHSAIEKGSW